MSAAWSIEQNDDVEPRLVVRLEHQAGEGVLGQAVPVVEIVSLDGWRHEQVDDVAKTDALRLEIVVEPRVRAGDRQQLAIRRGRSRN